MIRIHHNFDAIENYRNAWDDLAESQKCALLNYDWFRCCASAFHKKDTLYLVCVVEDGILIAVAPLYKCSHGDLNHLLQIIGNRRLYEPTSLLFRDKSALALLFKACTGIGHPLLLSRCYMQIDMSAYYRKISFRGIRVSMAAASSQHLELSSDFESYENSLSSRRRYDIRRAQKKAKHYGELDYAIHRVNQANLNDLLQWAYEIENRSWKRKAGSSIVLNQDLEQFFSCLFGSIYKKENALIGFLTINGEAVASHLAIQQFGRLWTLKIGYDPEYSSCSPGILLCHEMIRYAHDNKLEGFEFLGSREKWIELWKPEIRNYQSQLFYPLSYNGIIGLLKDATKIILSRLRGRQSS